MVTGGNGLMPVLQVMEMREVDSPFVGYAGPLTETVLMGNLILRSFNIREKISRKDPVYGQMEGYTFPGQIY